MRKLFILLIPSLMLIFVSCAQKENKLGDEFESTAFVKLSETLYHNSFAIDVEGVLWGTGRNQSCELADAIEVCKNDVNSWVKTTLSGAKSVASGNFHTVVLMDDNTVRVAGDRTRGQIGISSGVTSVNIFAQPEFESQRPASVVKIAAGHYGTYLLDDGGGVWGTGYYFNGQLTYNDAPTFNSFKEKFIRVPTPEGVKFAEIAYGYDQVLAIDTEGQIWATGGNRDGQLGVGADVNSDVFGFTKFEEPSVKFVKISAGGAGSGNGTDGFNGPRHSIALDENSDIWVTGNNEFGQLGTGDYVSVNKFTKVNKPAGINKFTEVAAGGMVTILLTDDGDIWATGNNIDYSLGVGEIEKLNVFTKIPKPDTVEYFVNISAGARHFQAIDQKGRVWTAGANEYGQLGLGLEIDLNSVAKTLSRRTEKAVALEFASVQNPNVISPEIDDTLKVGFIGNSLTFTNNIPLRLQEIATANDKKLEFKSQAISGDILTNQFIYRDWAAHRIVTYYRPKYVLLQEQTSGRDLAPVGWWRAFASSYGIEPILYQAWYNHNGCNASNTNSDALGLKVIPTGHAFQYIARATPGNYACRSSGSSSQQDEMNLDTILTKPNDYHPNMTGAYMSALTIYATLYGITDENTIIKKPAVLHAQHITDDYWNNTMVKVAIGAVNYNKKSAELRATRLFTNKTINNANITLTAEYQSNSYAFIPYVAHNIPFTLTQAGKLDILMNTDDAGSFYWFLKESNGRMIGKSAPSVAWPLREEGSCLNRNDLSFLETYQCNRGESLSETFFAYGDRVVGGIPYADQILPAGEYTLVLVEAAGTTSNIGLSIRVTQ